MERPFKIGELLMLAFIKGYLLLGLICTVIFVLIIKYDSEEYNSDDTRDWD
jgi:hypothetical protein